MNPDRQTIKKLLKYAQVFLEARERNANESDTVMFLIKFFEEVLGYDSLAGEISKEVKIKDKYCDFAIKLKGNIEFLVEAKSAGNNILREKDIEQAENYASHKGIRWVLLTNGIEWKLFHLTFSEDDGIEHDEIFSVNYVDEIDTNPKKIWELLGLLTKDSIKNELHTNFLTQKKALSPASLIKALFSESVIKKISREINSTSEVRLEIKDVFEGLKEIITTDAYAEAGDISMRKRRKKKRKSKDVTLEATEIQDNSSEPDKDDYIEEIEKSG